LNTSKTFCPSIINRFHNANISFFIVPIVVAAKLGIPLVDCDGMGRAFPELPMVTFHLNGMSATPMAITDVESLN
jgi:DUF917 family protein